MERIYNFNAGPAVLPPSVLERAQAELRDYRGKGLSVMEMSHRSKEYEALNAEAETRFLRLLGLDAGYRVVFLQGGASLQFAMVPLNFLPRGSVADYVLTGVWSEKARDEAALLGEVHVAASTEADAYRRIPRAAEIVPGPRPAYLHITSNNTIYGTQWHWWPEAGDVPLVADMSSDIFARPLEARRFSLIYAGAQKNLGPSGVTVVLVREEFLATAATAVPTMLRYATHVKSNSLYNTPPTFGVYMLNLVLAWIEDQGGLEAMGRRNQAKAGALYGVIDESGGFYRGHAQGDSRSTMNVTFHLPTAELEKEFLSGAAAAGMIGLPGHRSVGGVRASLYNALDLEACTALAGFMREFARTRG